MYDVKIAYMYVNGCRSALALIYSRYCTAKHSLSAATAALVRLQAFDDRHVASLQQLIIAAQI